MTAAEAAERRSSRRWAAGLGAAFIVGFMAYSLWWMPVVHGVHGWLTPTDIWMTTRVSEYIRYGAYPYIYQSAGGYYDLPLVAILMLPAIVVSNAFNLVTGFPYVLPHPSMWLVVGPYSAALGAVSLDAARRLAWAYGLRRRLWVVQLAAVGTVLLPCTYNGHPEDAVAVAAICYALAAARRGGWDRTALWLAVAVCSKQWAILAVPALFFACPAEHRRRFAALAVLPPVAMVAPPLLLDHADTVRALLLPTTPTDLIFGHRSPLLSLLGHTASRYSRTATVVGAAVGGAWIGRRRPAAVPAAIAAFFLLRAFTEPLIFGYYFAPFLTLLLVLAACRRGRVVTGDIAALVLCSVWLMPERMNNTLFWIGTPVVALLVAAQLLLLSDASAKSNFLFLAGLRNRSASADQGGANGVRGDAGAPAFLSAFARSLRPDLTGAESAGTTTT